MTFTAPGKLMLSGEYVVLNGATAFAIPVRFGQTLQITTNKQSKGHLWRSFENQTLWLEILFSKDLSQIIHTTDKQKALQLQKILQYIYKQKPELWQQNLFFSTQLDFNRNWGLGSSSTLIVLLHKWSGINPFDLLNISFQGSGYDIAVALENTPVLYTLKKEKDISQYKFIYKQKYPSWKKISFNPPFAEQLFFVYLNKKQNSRKEIRYYSKINVTQQQVKKITSISNMLINTKKLSDFEDLINRHETIISTILKRPTIKEEKFADYPGSIKSLGAWGGDFILATGNKAPEYFSNKNYKLIIPFNQMINF